MKPPKLDSLRTVARTALQPRKCRPVAALLLACYVVGARAEQILYQTDWQNGIGPRLIVQAVPGELTVIDDPERKYPRVLQARIQRSENYSTIANGTPRAEVLFPVRFAQGQTYRIQWSTMLPPDTRFDAQQFVIVTQIHQGPKTGGPPPVALAELATRYGITQRGGQAPHTASAGQWLCCADSDVGKWVEWELLYRPSESGNDALTELRRNGVLVFHAAGRPNAYPGDQRAYLKLGLYKPEWQVKATEVQSVLMMYGPVTISQE